MVLFSAEYLILELKTVNKTAISLYYNFGLMYIFSHYQKQTLKKKTKHEPDKVIEPALKDNLS